MGCRLCSPTAPGRCLHFECRGAPARVRAWRCEGRPPLPHHFVCVETFTLPYLLSRSAKRPRESRREGGKKEHRPRVTRSEGEAVSVYIIIGEK